MIHDELMKSNLPKIQNNKKNTFQHMLYSVTEGMLATCNKLSDIFFNC